MVIFFFDFLFEVGGGLGFVVEYGVFVFGVVVYLVKVII